MSSIYFLGNSTKVQMLGFVIVSEGKTAVIDGGAFGDERQLKEILLKLGGHVDAWFFTHPHHDHIGAFYKILKKPDGISIDRIYHHFPSLDELKKYGSRHDGEIALWEGLYSKLDAMPSDTVQVVNAGNIIELGDVRISVLRVFNDEILANFVNNSSTVYRIDGEKASVLILGDLGSEGGDEVMAKCPREALLTDYTQMAHHGQGGVKREFYEYISPKCCIWPSPDWLWDNDDGEGFDTGPWQTVRTREWMDAIGVTEHIIEKDGIQIIEI